MSEYIEKLSRIKNDISIIQDSIFFEFHKLDQEITRLKKTLEIANRLIELISGPQDFYCEVGDRNKQAAAIEAQKQIKELLSSKAIS